MLLRWTSVLGILAILARLSPVLGASPMDVTYLYMGIQIGSVMDNQYVGSASAFFTLRAQATSLNAK